jgi:predicted PurR-regulated permease PerM
MTPRSWLIAAWGLACVVLLYLLGPVLTPFVIALLLAYLMNPLLNRMTSRRLSRGGAVGVVFAVLTLVAVALLLGLLPMLERQVARALDKGPQLAAWWVEVAVPTLRDRFGVDPAVLDPHALVEALRSHWQQAGGVAARIGRTLGASGTALLAFAGTAALVPVVTFYFARDWPELIVRIRALIPRAWLPNVDAFTAEADDVLGAFFRGQLTVMAALAVFYTLGLGLVGLDVALLVGVVAGLVSFVPYLGVIVGGGAAVVAALVEFRDVLHPVMALGVFVLGQVLEGFVLTPWLVGDKVGLHPVAVIFAVLVGGQLFGFVGVLVALPVAAVALIGLRHAHTRYLESDLYRTDETE